MSRSRRHACVRNTNGAELVNQKVLRSCDQRTPETGRWTVCVLSACLSSSFEPHLNLLAWKGLFAGLRRSEGQKVRIFFPLSCVRKFQATVYHLWLAQKLWHWRLLPEMVNEHPFTEHVSIQSTIKHPLKGVWCVFTINSALLAPLLKSCKKGLGGKKWNFWWTSFISHWKKNTAQLK